MELSRQEYWSGLPFPTPGAIPDPETEPLSPVSPVLAGEFFTTAPPGKLPHSLASLLITSSWFPPPELPPPLSPAPLSKTNIAEAASHQELYIFHFYYFNYSLAR